MPEEKKNCSECGTAIGPGTDIDVYKHTVSCFHLPDIGKDQLLKIHGARTDEYSKRIVKNLK